MDRSSFNDGAEFSQTPPFGQSGQTLKPGLYIVATPVGNLRDITLRALDVLAAAKAVYCEDTRVTQKLLGFYGLQKTLVRCDAHKEGQRASEIAARVASGEIVALVSDAGTPGISDPGALLVGECHALNVPVIPIPGVSALTAALSVSGFAQTSFAFLGFLPPRSAARRQILQAWSKSDVILALYEAPQRVEELLEDIEKMLGPRQIMIARELTKTFETLYHGTPDELKQASQDKNFKGEVVMLIAPSSEESQDNNQEEIITALQAALQKVSLREAVAQVTAQTGLPRKTIYALALTLQRDD